MTAALPEGLYCARDYEDLAAAALEPALFAHLMGGAGRERAVAANLRAFEALAIVPRILRDLTAGGLAVSLAGRAWTHPIWLAPVAFQALFHPGAELETARAADAVDAPLVVSSLSSTPMEDLAKGATSARWFQLYVQPSRAATLDLIHRAEAAGYEALMLTVDASVKPTGLSALRAGFKGEATAANLRPYPARTVVLEPGESAVFQGAMRAAPTWSDIGWLQQHCRLPLWIKGVLSPADAKMAMEAGAAGVVVSNHGGRVLDSAPAALTMLPAVRQAVGDAFPLLFDGGVRSGEDAFKAIALGADAVMIGRLQACALAAAGALGVAHMVRTLCQELEVTMAASGCASLADIRAAELIPTPSVRG